MTDVRTILVVEDEIFILADLAHQLRNCGYRVIECLDATQAFAILATGSPLDLVFSDIQMPGPHDGHDLAHWVSRHRPEITVVLTSGDAQALSRAAADLGCETVPKPYLHHDLLDFFRALFDAASGPAPGGGPS